MRKGRLMAKVCMVMCFLAVVGGLGLQLNRAAEISARSKKIASLRSEIGQLTIDAQYLVIQISAKGNLDRVRDEAAQLGMLPPAAGQVRMISLPAGFGDITVAQAAEAPDNDT